MQLREQVLTAGVSFGLRLLKGHVLLASPFWLSSDAGGPYPGTCGRASGFESQGIRHTALSNLQRTQLQGCSKFETGQSTQTDTPGSTKPR